MALKDDLRAECLQRGLPVSGTVEELTARIQGFDAAQAEAAAAEGEAALLAAAGIASDAPSAPPEASEGPPETSTVSTAPPDPPVSPEASNGWPGELTDRVARVWFPCADQIVPTDLHLQWLEQVPQMAREHGIATRGGARRAGWIYSGGQRCAVYEISVRR